MTGASSAGRALTLALAKGGAKVARRARHRRQRDQPGLCRYADDRPNKFPMPFMIGAADAARRSIRGLRKGKFEIAFPWQLVALMKLGRLLPYPMFFWCARTFLAPPRRWG